MRTFASVLMIFLVSGMLILQACKRSYFEEIPVTKNVSFEEHIKPITQTLCIQCHSQGSKDYSRYQNAYWMRHSIFQKVVVDKTMPVGKYLSDKDRALFRDWVNQGGNR